MSVVGTQNANNLISISTDGKMCSWSLDMLSQPQASHTVELHNFVWYFCWTLMGMVKLNKGPSYSATLVMSLATVTALNFKLGLTDPN